MKKFRKWFFIGLAIFIISFLLQNTIRSIFAEKENAKMASLVATLSIAEIEQQLNEQCNQLENSVIPCEWYYDDGFMPPIVAGVLDGAYLAGMSTKDMAVLIYQYVRDEKVREELNKAAQTIWANRNEVLAAIAASAKDYGKELSGSKGFVHSEYMCGRGVFEIATVFAGAAVVTKGSKATKIIQKVTKKVSAYSKRLQKIAIIRKSCPPCAELFKKSNRLRKKLLNKDNIAETQRLLHKDWKASGKTWEVFINDYEAHHIIPANTLDLSAGLQIYYNNGGKFRFNSIDNGILLKKVAEGGFHAKHPKYTEYVIGRVNKITRKIEIQDVITKEHIKLIDKQLMDLTEEIKNNIINESIKKGVKINEIF